MSVTPDEIARAADVLRAGGLVAFPTETVYGLGADAWSPAALARLYEVKGRPAHHPVIVHLPDATAVDAWAVDVPDAARRLAEHLWPGPLTLVLHRAPGVLDAVTGGQDTVGLRVPDQPVALELLRAFGGGIAAPSANRFGRVSPTTADHVRADLDGDVDVVLDGGACRVGVESTIVDCTRVPFGILRVGGTSRADVEAAAGVPVQALPVAGGVDRDEVRVPGALASHYAPRARVVVVGADDLSPAVDRELAAGLRVGAILSSPVVFGRADDLAWFAALCGAEEYARRLYGMLRDADAHRVDVVVALVPDEADDPLSAAVADRLRRAAAPRPSAEQEGT